MTHVMGRRVSAWGRLSGCALTMLLATNRAARQQ